jgi:hypothetical protein
VLFNFSRSKFVGRGIRKKESGRRNQEEGIRKKESGRRNQEEGIRKKESGRRAVPAAENETYFRRRGGLYRLHGFPGCCQSVW